MNYLDGLIVLVSGVTGYIVFVVAMYFLSKDDT